MDEHAGTKINELDACFGSVFEEDVFRLDVWMDDVLLFEEGQTIEQLKSKGSDVL